MQTRKIGALELPYEISINGKLICPNCGDTKFGSAVQSDGSLIRTCHGNVSDEEVCAFKWLDADDHKYFYVAVQDFLTVWRDIKP
jgi:hypothetical protein